jgi:hypothetical protein
VFTPFLLAGWAGRHRRCFDGTVTRQMRVSSVFAAPGIDLDADLADTCHDTADAAFGALVMRFQCREKWSRSPTTAS